LSLRVKFLSLLVLVPSLCLAIFLYFAVKTFVDDKRTFLLEEHFNLLNAASLFLSGENSNDFQAKLQNLIQQEGFESLLVVNNTGQILVSSEAQIVDKPIIDVLGRDSLEKLAAQTAVEGSFESKDANGEERFVSFMKVPTGTDSVVMLMHQLKSSSMRASTLFFLKSGSVFVALLSFAVLVSLLFSGKLSKGILQLSQAMVAFGKGDSHAPLPAASNDEVGLMTRQFQSMRLQISHLMESEKEKAKIETEMQLAGDLQRRFFPENYFQVKGSEFAGFFEPAQDAGGDWWFYFLKNNELIFIVGDVTGHGLNSAMITAVSRSALSLIEDHFVSPGESLRLLNRAIYDASKGDLCMTSVVGALNIDNGQLRYAVASHEAPIAIAPEDRTLKSKEFVFLNDVNGPRLGESPTAEYKEATYQMKHNEAILFYTDGLTDLQSTSRKLLSERQLLRSLGQDHSSQLSAVQLLEKVKSIAFTHRLSAELVDDLSFFFIKWRSPT
jgi:sigma-B regulation protein RsbU (phosphoserine phosphatase)